ILGLLAMFPSPTSVSSLYRSPVFVKNMLQTDVAIEQETRGSQTAPIVHSSAWSEDVTCDSCIERKRKATKLCLQCTAYYCEEHLQLHNELVPLKKHKLLEASTNLQELMCSRHNEVKRIFCRTDQQCICSCCSTEEHSGHRIVSAEKEMAERQKKARETQQVVKQRIQSGEQDMEALQQEVDAINSSAEKAVKDSETMSTELVQLIQKNVFDVKQRITSQQEMEVRRVRELQEEVKKELVELKKKDSDLEKLSHTTDEVLFLHNCPLPHLSESTHSRRLDAYSLHYFEGVRKATAKARKKIRDSCDKEWKEIIKTVIEVDVLLPKTRAELLRYSLPLTLDPNTAHAYLLLSKKNRKVTYVKDYANLQRPHGFEDKYQVVSGQPLSGRCYWEVKWRGLGVSVAVTYKDISRTGVESEFGNNDKSYVLDCSGRSYNTYYKFKHNGNKTDVTGLLSFRIGVFLDHRAGTLSFYRVSNTVTLLHRVQTTFTQPLYAGLTVRYYNATVLIIKPKQPIESFVWCGYV
uniref:B30.2/SPRY domain-containing protein n=1 Tax=Anabas testudineus TaxID=64144 RepID=A0A3Q1HLX6_ANATE